MSKYILKECGKLVKWFKLNRTFPKIIVAVLGIIMINSILLNYVFASVVNKEFLKVNVPSAVVIDSESGRVLYEKNAYEKRSMASLTKVMTSIMLVEYCEMNEKIEVPSEATWIGGSEVGIKKGEKILAKNLLYGMLLPSGNDCAYTVGLHIGGTIEKFSTLMNEKAKEIGALNTNFMNPHGLDNEQHYTTAYDMALITKYALKNKYINEVANTKSATVNFGSFSKLLSNTNALLKSNPKVDGVKTGFTNLANRCLIVSATDNNERYISVVLGAETTKDRFKSGEFILEESFKRYKKTDISKYLNFYIKVPVIKGNIENYEIQISENMSLPLTNEEFEAIYIKQDIVENLKAPVNAGEVIGKVEVFIEEEKIYEKEIILEESISKKNMLDYIKQGLGDMFAKREMF